VANAPDATPRVKPEPWFGNKGKSALGLFLPGAGYRDGKSNL
jgi:hypothetical protein